MVSWRRWNLLLLLNVVIWRIIHLLHICCVHFTSIPLLQVASAASRASVEATDCVRIVMTLGWRSFVRNCECLLQSWEGCHAEGWTATCRRCHFCYTSVVILVWAMVEWLVHHLRSLQQITWQICLGTMSLTKPLDQIDRLIRNFSLLLVLRLWRLIWFLFLNSRHFRSFLRNSLWLHRQSRPMLAQCSAARQYFLLNALSWENTFLMERFLKPVYSTHSKTLSS